MEIWKDIKGYEGLYQVSNLGRVKSLPKYHQKDIKIMSYTLRSGYKTLILRKNGKRKSMQIHRLVAEAFIPNINNKPFVNHKDFNRQNNNIENLEWVTQKENINWSRQNYCGKKKITKSNTGEKYITFRISNNTYRVTTNKKEYHGCKTLEEAIKMRDKILNQL